VKILRKRQSSEPALPWTQRDPMASPSMVTGELGVYGVEYENRANGFAYGIPMKRNERWSRMLKIISVSVGNKRFSIKL